MVDISRFRTDSRAIMMGEWVLVDEVEYGDLEIRTRGFTDEYFDAQSRRQRAEAKRLGVVVENLPSGMKRKINVDCICEFMVLDVRNLTIKAEGDRPILIEEFYDYLRNPDFPELIVACFRAAGKVGQSRDVDVEEAVGNLLGRSSTSSPGDATPPSSRPSPKTSDPELPSSTTG